MFILYIGFQEKQMAFAKLRFRELPNIMSQCHYFLMFARTVAPHSLPKETSALLLVLLLSATFGVPFLSSACTSDMLKRAFVDQCLEQVKNKLKLKEQIFVFNFGFSKQMVFFALCRYLIFRLEGTKHGALALCQAWDQE